MFVPSFRKGVIFDSPLEVTEFSAKIGFPRPSCPRAAPRKKSTWPPTPEKKQKINCWEVSVACPKPIVQLLYHSMPSIFGAKNLTNTPLPLSTYIFNTLEFTLDLSLFEKIYIPMPVLDTNKEKEKVTLTLWSEFLLLLQSFLDKNTFYALSKNVCK